MNTPEPQGVSQQSESVFYASRQAGRLIPLGITMLVIAIMGLVVNNAVMNALGAPAIVVIVIGVWRKNNPLITFGSDNFEARLGLTSWHTILYDEVKKIEVSPKKLVIEYRKANEPADTPPVQIKILLDFLQEMDRPSLIQAFRAHCPGSIFFVSS
jgi:hypothetical protein